MSCLCRLVTTVIESHGHLIRLLQPFKRCLVHHLISFLRSDVTISLKGPSEYEEIADTAAIHQKKLCLTIIINLFFHVRQVSRGYLNVHYKDGSMNVSFKLALIRFLVANTHETKKFINMMLLWKMDLDVKGATNSLKFRS